MKKQLIFVMASLFLLLSNTSYGETELKIGYVNMNRAINLSNEGQRSKKFLEEQANRTRKYLKEQEQKVLKMQAELKNNIMLNQEARSQKQLQISQMRQELRNEVAKAEKSFRKSESQHTSKIFSDLLAVVKKIAEEGKYDLILEFNMKQMVLFSKYQMVDVTEQVIAEYNKIQSLK